MSISQFAAGRPSTGGLAAGALCATVFLFAGCTGTESPASPRPAVPDGIQASVVKTPVVGTEVRFEECLGEEIRVEYREQLVEHESVDAQGRTHIHMNINDKGSTAVGLTSGTTYRQVGTSRENDLIVDPASLPKVFSFVNVLDLIGRGTATNLTIHEVFHLTLNASGVITADRETVRITCD